MYLRIQAEEARRKAEEEASRKAEAEAKRKAEEEARRKEEEQARKLMPWFESIGLPRQDAMDVALACVRQKVYCALSLCTLPEEDLCKALRPLPPGLWCYMPMIIQAVRVCKTDRRAATPTALNATVKDWMRDAGLNEAMAEAVGLVLTAEGMRSKGLVMAQEQHELELVARKMPAPAMHIFLATVQDARNQQQFTLGLPPRLIQDKWAAPLKPFLVQVGTFDDATIREIETACGNDDLKIRCIFALCAMEDSELSRALTAANLPPIVQKMLINEIQNKADRIDTQWVVDTESPCELGQLTIYTRKDWDARKAEEEERKRAVEDAARAVEHALAAQKSAVEVSEFSYTATWGKCNHKFCRKAKKEHFGTARRCFDPQRVATATAAFTQAQAMLTQRQAELTQRISELEAEAKAKAEAEAKGKTEAKRQQQEDNHKQEAGGGSGRGSCLEEGRCRIDRKLNLGSGSFADVVGGTYRFPGQGVDTSTQVAFKIFRGGRDLASRVREKIKEEVELGMKLQHPNLVILFGMFNHDQYGQVLVLKLCPGGSLRSSRQGPLGWHNSPVEYADQVVDGNCKWHGPDARFTDKNYSPRPQGRQRLAERNGPRQGCSPGWRLWGGNGHGNNQIYTVCTRWYGYVGLDAS